MSCHIWAFDKNLFSSVKNKKTRSLKGHRQNRSIPLKLQIVKIYNQTKNRPDFAESLFKNLSADLNKFVKGIQKWAKEEHGSKIKQCGSHPLCFYSKSTTKLKTNSQDFRKNDL